MGMVNEVVPHADLERVALEWAREVNGKSPTAQRMLKYAFNLLDDGLVGQQLFAGEATRLAYLTDEAVEGRDAFLQKRDPDWTPVPLALLRLAGPCRRRDVVAAARRSSKSPGRITRPGTLLSLTSAARGYTGGERRGDPAGGKGDDGGSAARASGRTDGRSRDGVTVGVMVGITALVAALVVPGRGGRTTPSRMAAPAVRTAAAETTPRPPLPMRARRCRARALPARQRLRGLRGGRCGPAPGGTDPERMAPRWRAASSSTGRTRACRGCSSRSAISARRAATSSPRS